MFREKIHSPNKQRGKTCNKNMQDVVCIGARVLSELRASCILIADRQCLICDVDVIAPSVCGSESAVIRQSSQQQQWKGSLQRVNELA